jgi:hypothetical protein
MSDDKKLVDDLLVAADKVVAYADMNCRDEENHEIPAEFLELWKAVNSVKGARYDRR